MLLDVFFEKDVLTILVVCIEVCSHTQIDLIYLDSV